MVTCQADGITGITVSLGDQSDNAQRIQRMGVGRILAARRFTAGRAAPVIASLVGDSSYRAEAERAGAVVACEDGAEAAATAIEKIIGRAS